MTTKLSDGPGQQSPAPPKLVNERYEVVRPLGSGGSATVFEVRDLRTSSPYAMKILHSGVNEALMRAEFARLSRLRDHPCLVKVHDLSRLEDGRLFLLMDLVQGRSPRQVLDQLPAEQRDQRLREMAEDLCSALALVHDHGLVHHDVKPDNLLVCARSGRVILFDLGLATRARLDGPAARGTLPYMAPEGLAGGGDHRVDLYGIGATLYQLAVGSPPFTGKGVQLIRRILEQRPSLKIPWLGRDTAALILKLLTKDPLKRPASTRVVLAELARIRGDHEAVAELSARRALLSPAFVGRDRQLARLVDALRSMVDRAVPGLVTVTGGPGLGKTRLIEEALRQVRIGAAAGRFPELEIREASTAELLEGAWSDQARTERSVDDLAIHLLDRLEERARRRGRPLLVHLRGGLDHDLVGARLAQVLVLGSESDAAPVVVIGETHPGHLPAMEIPDGRPSEHANRALRLELSALSKSGVARLVASILGEPASPSVSRRIHQLSGGKPALVIELTRQWSQQGEDGLALERTGELDPLLERGRRWMGTKRREVMDALAVWGEAASTEVLERLLDKPHHGEEIWGSLEQLSREGSVVLDSTGHARLPSQAHVKAWRRAQEEECRRRLHLRAARLLEERDEADSTALTLRMAEHLWEANEPEALSAALRAGRALAAEYDAPGAVLWLERVISSALGEEARPLLARQYIQIGRYGDALTLLDRTDGPLGLLRAEALQRKGAYQEAVAVVEQLVPDLEHGSSLRHKSTALLGRLKLQQGRSAEALRATEAEAVQIMRGRADGLTLEGAALLEVTGLAQIYLGELEQADRVFAWGEAALADSSHLAQQARLLDYRGMVAFSSGDLRGAEAYYQRALELASRVGDVHGRATYLHNLGAALLNLGRLGEALTHFTTAIRELGRLARTTELASALCNMGNLLLQLGDLDHAQRTVDRARELASSLGADRTEGFLIMLSGDLVRRRGDIEQAIRCYEQAAESFDRLGAAREKELCGLARADVLTEAGRLEESRVLLQDPLLEQHPETALSRARLILAEGDKADRGAELMQVERALAEHCGRLAERGATRELWRCAMVLGGLLAARGSGRAAREALGQAKRYREEIVSNSPEIYHEKMAEDPDALSLASQWEALAGQSTEEEPQPRSSPGVPPRYESRWLRRLLTINKRLNSELRLPRLLELIMDTVIELTEAERGLLLLREDDESLSIKVARNIDQRSLEGEELSISRSIAEQAARSGEPVVTIDAAEDQRFQEALSVSDLRLRSVLAVPLLVKGRSVGTIYIDHRLRQGVFGSDEVHLIQDFADQAAIAIDNARLLAENQRKTREIERLNRRLQRKVDRQEAELVEVREELRSSRQALTARYDYKNLIGATTRMHELFQLLDRVTETELPVVIQGESGTGKELVARAIHENGSRASKPFLGENCAAIPETLLESVLFGHVKGAFTGATRDRKGLFEVTSGGTLFLDEVGEMSPSMQTKLLRVLQDGELRRVGGTQTIKTDVRVIAASNKKLSQLVEQGRFREDLFYRLNVIQIDIPALRERREDIPLLVDHFLKKHLKSDADDRRVGPEAMALLMGYPWPGNVRELENEIMRAGALGGKVIQPSDLSPHVSGSVPLELSDPDDLDLRKRVQHVERELIQRALKRTGGNHTRAARLLGLSRYGLLKKLQRFGAAQGKQRKATG